MTVRENGTIQECIDNGYSITAWCPANHSRKLPLVELAAKLGDDFPATRDALLPKLRCSKCNAQASAIIMSPASGKEGWPARHRP
ncbi:MAG: hypothetical protein Rhirs2KO_18670 [Rhizobiaceae bacterium]